jgi:exonuclease III
MIDNHPRQHETNDDTGCNTNADDNHQVSKRQRTTKHKRCSGLKNGKIKGCTYNINSGRGERLISAVRAMSDMNMDFAILTETKLQDGIHAKYYQGYEIEATNAKSKHQGGVALIWKEGASHGIESIRHHGPDVLSFELVTGSFRWLVIGAYISPNLDGKEECNYILQARNQRPRLPIIISGDLNVDLEKDNQDERSQRISNCLSIIGVEDMSKHYRRRHRFFDGMTWRQYRELTWIKSRCDYVLSDNIQKFQSVRIADPRRYDSDHYAV